MFSTAKPCYRVIAPIQSIRLQHAGGDRGAVDELPVGSLLEFEGPSALGARIVEVSRNGYRHALFGDDLQLRAKTVDECLPSEIELRKSVA